MTSAAKKVLADALALSLEDQRRVVEALIDALPRETSEALEAAWNDEAKRRAGKLERGEEVALDGAEALQALAAKLSGVRGS